MASIPIVDRLAYAKQVITVLLSHLAYIAPMFGLPIVVTVLAAFGWLPADACESRSCLRIMSIFALVVFGCLLSMTSSATVVFARVNPSELGRMHGRYYDFALPLFLLSFYAVRGGKLPRKIRRSFFWGVLICLLFALVGWRLLARLQPVFATDYPELGWVTQPNQIVLTVFWLVAVLVMMYYAIVGLKERTTYSVYLLTTFIAGSILTLYAQHGFDVETLPDQAAALVRGLFEPNERDLGLVAGSDPAVVRQCLFGIQANPTVLELPAGTIIDRRRIGEDVRWMLALNDYDLRVPSTVVLVLPGIKIVRLLSPPAGVSEHGHRG
jgi:phosphoglycerol transferase